MRFLPFIRWWRDLSPPALLAASFAALIGVGTLGLLYLPGLYVGPGLGFVDALFTSTSAVCVTGLIVVDTATYFTPWGQLWILVLIQLGGLGIVTLTSLIMAMLGRRLTLRTQVLAVPALETEHGHHFFYFARDVARYVFVIEGAGVLLLFVQFLPYFDAAEAAWHAVFHAVSAFCNAGFSTFSRSLADYARDPGVLVTVSGLIIFGSFGYLGAVELLRRWRQRDGARRRLSMHTYAATVTTAVLLVGGTVLYAIFEWEGTLSPMGVGDRLVNAWFMSTTARTAGFNSVNYSELSNAGAYLTILLMVVGGSPGSTAGGLKTTTLAILAALALSRMRGRRFVELHGRAMPDGTVQRAVSMALLAFGLLTALIFLLGYTETLELPHELARQSFLPIMFEAVSAFGTVGLSMDMTPLLGPAGKVQITILMFVGRVGLLVFFAAISVRSRAFPSDLRPAREDLIIG